LERTTLKKTRFTTSGTSMPVSSMSTERAICGALSFLEKTSMRLCTYSVWKVRNSDPREVPAEIREILVEALGDEVGMGLVLGEQDGLAQPVAALHLEAMGHQVGQHLVHGIPVEQPFIDRLRIHLIGNVALLVPFEGVPLVLLFLGQIVVADAIP